MSALGARAGARARYHQTKWAAEKLVRAAGTEWGLRHTIFRPSVIHGPDGAFMRMVRGFWCKRWPPMVPYFGKGLLGRGGSGRLQPVWVEDVARCFAEALTRPASEGRAYTLGGPEVLTWPEFYLACRRHLTRPRRKPIVPIPAWWAMLLARLPGVPFNQDQVVMSLEDSTNTEATAIVARDFGFELTALETALARYAEAIG
jgi:NADH dehydrogenase